jgi:hypothetical protein
MESNVHSLLRDTQRPTFLTVICILSFIGSGYFAFGNILALTPSNYLSSLPGILSLAAGGPVNSIITLILSLASFVGVLFMWNQKKVGFKIYSVANIFFMLASIFLNPLYGKSSIIYVGFITGGFIAMYYFNIKFMNK